jgi:membrane protein YdbS with pleckstrin-like domain
MAREFDVNEDGLTAEGFKMLHPKIKSAMRVGVSLSLMFFFAALLLIWLFARDLPGGIYWPLMFLFVAINILIVLDLAFVPTVFYARYRYCVGDDRIDVLRGVFVIRHTVVPIERIHQVEITRGPIKNMFGLADVTITTAGGTATIEYLELQEARGIADKLNEKVLKILKERDTSDR